jgi:hypothetical protein
MCPCGSCTKGAINKTDHAKYLSDYNEIDCGEGAEGVGCAPCMTSEYAPWCDHGSCATRPVEPADAGGALQTD